MNIVFDFGGVLLDWNPPALIERMLPPSAPMRSPADWVTLIFEGFGGDWAQFDRGTLTAAALAQRIAARSGLSAEQALRIVQAVPRELQPVGEMM